MAATLVGGLVGLTCVDSAGAQPHSRALRLGDVYEEARVRNPRIEAARAAARVVDARIPGARLPQDPQLQLGWMNRSLSGFDPMPGLGMTQLTLMQRVPIAGQLRLKVGIARSQANAAHERASETGWGVRTAVAMAFYDLYATERQLDVTRETLRLLHDIARTAESMYRVGGGRQTDVLRARVEIARMTEDTIRMHTMRVALQSLLAALVDRREMDTGVPMLPAFPAVAPALNEVQQLAVAGRRVLRAATAELTSAERAQQLAKREIWPDLEIGIAYAQGPAFGTMDGPARNETMVSLMVGATLPIFARGRQLAMREEAAAMTQMSRAELAESTAETRARVAAAHAELELARRLQALYRTAILPQARAAAESALSAYRVGTVDFMTLLDHQMTVNEYRGQLAVLEAGEGKAWAELEMLTATEFVDVQAHEVIAGGER